VLGVRSFFRREKGSNESVIWSIELKKVQLCGSGEHNIDGGEGLGEFL